MDFEHCSYESGIIEEFYQNLSRQIIQVHGPLRSVEYLNHFPTFEIQFTYEDGWSIISGERHGVHDIHFMSLGYVGEGPRYAQHFLHAAGFKLSSAEIAQIEPGDRLECIDNKVVITHTDDL